MTSKLVNKGSVMGNTFKERVDQLIAKSNQEPLSNRRGNPNGHNFDRAPYIRSQRPERNLNSNFQKPRNDIHQNLQGPEPSAAGPFDGPDGSRLIQCLRCRGWGHPRRLCPSWLNYTRGEQYGGLPPRKRIGNQRILLPATRLLSNRHAYIMSGSKIS